MHVRFVYPSFDRPSVSNPELTEITGADAYLGTPSMAIAILAALTPAPHTVDLRDDRLEPLGYDDAVDLVAMPVFTPAANRAMEIADEFRARGVPVVVGGVFSSLMPDEMAPHVDAVVIGEGEPVWPDVLADAERKALKPVYRHEGHWDVRSASAVPRYDLYLDKFSNLENPAAAGHMDLPLQISRGCPIVCEDCVIPPYMGSRVRFYDPEYLAECFRFLADPEIQRGVCLTEDISIFPISAVLKHFLSVVDACEGIGPKVSYIGVSPQFTLQAKPEFFEGLRRLDAFQLYLVFGFDPLSHKAFRADPDPKAWQDAIDAVKRTHDEGLYAYCSLLMGHDHEDEGAFDRILEFTALAGVESAEFPILTPYPGTPLWHRLVKEDRILHRDWSRYNDANVTFQPKNYSPERLLEGYLHVWREFYKGQHKPALPIQV